MIIAGMNSNVVSLVEDYESLNLLSIALRYVDLDTLAMHEGAYEDIIATIRHDQYILDTHHDMVVEIRGRERVTAALPADKPATEYIN